MGHSTLVRIALAAALPHLRRQIIAECVQIVTGRLQMLKSFAARNSDAKLDDTLEETENIRLLLTDLLDAPTKEGDDE